MTQSKSERLQVVLDMADREEKSATDSVEEIRAKLQAEEEKLQGLINYYDEYASDFGQSEKLTTARQIQMQRTFLEKLSEAKAQQQLQIQNVNARLQEKIEIWRKIYLKNKSLHDYVSRLRLDEQKQLTKKEERLLDDWFTRASRKIT